MRQSSFFHYAPSRLSVGSAQCQEKDGSCHLTPRWNARVEDECQAKTAAHAARSPQPLGADEVAQLSSVVWAVGLGPVCRLYRGIAGSPSAIDWASLLPTSCAVVGFGCSHAAGRRSEGAESATNLSHGEDHVLRLALNAGLRGPRRRSGRTHGARSCAARVGAKRVWRDVRSGAMSEGAPRAIVKRVPRRVSSEKVSCGERSTSPCEL